MITPTVGRIVWFRAKLQEGLPQDTPERAAIVVGVLGDRAINVLVFDFDGHAVPMLNVLLLQDDDSPPTAVSYCQWMPYQKGQALKSEQASKSPAAPGGAK